MSRLETLVAQDTELLHPHPQAGAASDVPTATSGSTTAAAAATSSLSPVFDESAAEAETAVKERTTSFLRQGRDDSEAIVAFICSEDVMKIAVALDMDDEEDGVKGKASRKRR